MFSFFYSLIVKEKKRLATELFLKKVIKIEFLNLN